MQLARFFPKLYAFEFDCVETTQCLAISINFEHLQNRVNKSSLSVVDGIWAADSESEVVFALSRQNFELFAFLTHA